MMDPPTGVEGEGEVVWMLVEGVVPPVRRHMMRIRQQTVALHAKYFRDRNSQIGRLHVPDSDVAEARLTKESESEIFEQFSNLLCGRVFFGSLLQMRVVRRGTAADHLAKSLGIGIFLLSHFGNSSSNTISSFVVSIQNHNESGGTLQVDQIQWSEF